MAKKKGTSSHDTITGTTKNDVIEGVAGNDHISGLSGNDILRGGDGFDVLIGENGNDTLDGGNLDDWLTGGIGNDTLIGGPGADVFVFETDLNPRTNVDSITDFTTSSDKIWLSDSTFSKLTAGGALNASMLRIGSAAADANDYIIYNKDTGALSYDSNGNAAGGMVRFATLAKGLHLTGSDFNVFTASQIGQAPTNTPAPTPNPSPSSSYATTINTNGGWTDSAFVSSDGERMYFMYSRYNFFPWFDGKQPELRGPSRAGHQGNDINAFEDSDLYMSTKQPDGSWGTPVNLPFNNDGAAACPVEVDLGATRKLYYQVTSETGARIVERTYTVASNTWGAEKDLGNLINKPGTNSTNSHVSADDTSMWFTSDRAGGFGGLDIWFAKKVNGAWQAPTNLGAPVNTASDEDQIWVAANGSEAFFNRESSIFRAEGKGSLFLQPIVVPLPFDFVGEASLPNSANELYFHVPDPVHEQIKTMMVPRLGPNIWGAPIEVDNIL